ncbi:MAG: nucleotidyltransferase family protein [Pseudomonadota bacterium]
MAVAGVRPRIDAALLAAGSSSRMGAADKLLACRDGRPMLAQAMDGLIKSASFKAIWLVGRKPNDPFQSILAGSLKGGADLPNYRYLYNARANTGMAASVQCAIAALPASVDAILIALGDMPDIAPFTIRMLCRHFISHPDSGFIVPEYDGRRGNPVLISRRLFPLLEGLSGDRGARSLIKHDPDEVHRIAVGDKAVLCDIDTPDALQRWQHHSAPAE